MAHDLLTQLLFEQRQLTLVDQFADWHSNSMHQEGPYRANLPSLDLLPGHQLAFEVDLDACSGCKACVVACHTLNGLDEQETWRKVGVLHGTGRLPIIQHVTTACHHCVDPGCLNGCPVMAYEKDPQTGIVRHLDDQCFGCKYCQMMCPYEVPQYNASLGIVRKCDMCADRLSLGESPACVQACPNQAIRIRIVALAETGESQESARSLVATAPPNEWTRPTTRYLAAKQVALASSDELQSREGVGEQSQPAHLPLVLMLVVTQASVGLWGALTIAYFLNQIALTVVPTVAVTATAIGMVGLLAASFHLGRPWLAYRSILGWKRSWLSREAIAFTAYMSLATVTIALVAVGTLDWWISIGLGLTALSGGIAVYCSAMIYIATRRQLWSMVRTMPEFAATTACLGTALVSIWSVAGLEQKQLLILATIFGGLALVTKVLDWRAGQPGQIKWDDFAARSGRLLRGRLNFAFLCAVICIFSSAMLVMAVAMVEPGLIRSVLAAATISLLALSQLLTRWLYFASVVFPRMPGATT